MEQLNLYQKIDKDFFAILSSPNCIDYTECINIVYLLTQDEWSYGISREVITVAFAEYFRSDSQAYGIDCDYKESREKAVDMIRKLKDYNWIDIEITHEYIEMVTLKDNAFVLFETLSKLANESDVEYENKIHVIHMLLKGNTMMKPNQVVREVYNLTQELITNLKSLNSNIKQYTEKTMKETEVKNVLKILIRQYKHEVFDNAYRRLKTSDHVSRYRSSIQFKVEDLLCDDLYLDNASHEDVVDGNFENRLDAKEFLQSCLVYVNNAFANMHYLIDEIDQRNSQYMRAAIKRIKFKIENRANIEGDLQKMIKFQLQYYESSDKSVEYNQIVNGSHRLFRQHGIDEKSLYPIKRSKTKEIKEKVVLKRRTPERIRELRERNRKKKNRVISVDQINNEIQALLNDNEVISASSMKLESIDDFKRVVLAKAYSKDKSINYDLTRNKGRVINGMYDITDFSIRKRGQK